MNALDDETAKADRYQAWLLAVKPDSGDESYAIETFEDYIR